jgi:hypothetical protein
VRNEIVVRLMNTKEKKKKKKKKNENNVPVFLSMPILHIACAPRLDLSLLFLEHKLLQNSID